MIGHPPLREVVCADAFGTVAGTDLRLAVGGAFAVGLQPFEIVKPGAQHGHRIGAVLVLGLFRRRHDDAGRQVGDPNRRIGGIDVLTARTGRPHRVDADVGGGDVDLHLLGLGQHRDGGGGGVDAPARLGLWHALDTVDAAFELEAGKDPLALDPGHSLLDAAKLGLGKLHQVETPALRFGVFLIHAQQVAREKCGLFPAGAGADFEDRGAGIGGVLRQKRDPQPVLHRRDAILQRRDFILGQCLHLGVRQHRLGLLQIGTRLTVGGDLGHHGLQIGIFARKCRDLRRGGAGRKLRFEILEAARDLVELVQGHHGAGLACVRAAVKGERPGVSHPRTPVEYF